MISKTIQTFYFATLNLLLPPHCPSCGEERVNDQNVLCASCWLTVGVLGFSSCRTCGTKLYAHELSQNQCDLCLLKTNPLLEGWHKSWSLFESTPFTRTLMTSFLTGKNPFILPFLISSVSQSMISGWPELTHCLLFKRPDSSPALTQLIYGISRQLKKPFYIIDQGPNEVLSQCGQKGLVISSYWEKLPSLKDASSSDSKRLRLKDYSIYSLLSYRN